MSFTGCRPLDAAEEERFLAALAKGVEPARDLALGIISLRLGLRLSEILSIRLSQVWDGQHVMSHLSVPRRAVKNKRTGRILPLRPDVTRAIEAQIANLQRHSPTPLPRDGFLFPGRFVGTRLSRSAGWEIFKRAFKFGAITGGGGVLATHSGRKTMAAKVWRNTKDVFVLRDCLGHSDITTSQRYVQPRREDVDKAFLQT